MSLINVRVLLVIAGVVSGGLAQFYPSGIAPCQQPYLTPFGSSRAENGNSKFNINDQAVRYPGSSSIPQIPLPRSPLQLPLPAPSPFYSSQTPRLLPSISSYNQNPMMNVLPKNIDDNLNGKGNVDINSNRNYNENGNSNRYAAPMPPPRLMIPPRLPVTSPTMSTPVWTHPSVPYNGYPVGNLNANTNENTNVNINDNGNINANAFRRNMHGSSNDHSNGNTNENSNSNDDTKNDSS